MKKILNQVAIITVLLIILSGGTALASQSHGESHGHDKEENPLTQAVEEQDPESQQDQSNLHDEGQDDDHGSIEKLLNHMYDYYDVSFLGEVSFIGQQSNQFKVVFTDKQTGQPFAPSDLHLEFLFLAADHGGHGKEVVYLEAEFIPGDNLGEYLVTATPDKDGNAYLYIDINGPRGYDYVMIPIQIEIPSPNTTFLTSFIVFSGAVCTISYQRRKKKHGLLAREGN